MDLWLFDTLVAIMAQTALSDYYVRRSSVTSHVSVPAKDETGTYPDTFIGRTNKKFAKSKLGAYFDIEGRNTTLSDELRAGLVAFLTVRAWSVGRWFPGTSGGAHAFYCRL